MQHTLIAHCNGPPHCFRAHLPVIRLLHERLIESHSIDLNPIGELDHHRLWRLGAVDIEVPGRRDPLALENAVDVVAVLEHHLRRHVVHAKGLDPPHVLDHLCEGEALAGEGEEAVDAGPLGDADAVVEDQAVAEDDDFELAVRTQTVQNLRHRLRTRLLVHGAHCKHPRINADTFHCESDVRGTVNPTG